MSLSSALEPAGLQEARQGGGDIQQVGGEERV